MLRYRSLCVLPKKGIAEIPFGPGHMNGIYAFLSLRSEGNMSEVAAMGFRERFLARNHICAERVVGLQQRHGRRVVLVENSFDASKRSKADGLVTALRHPVLSITVADCLPIFLLDKSTGSFSVVHSGWRGTGIVLDALKLMERACGTRRDSVHVTIGPGIGPCCYDVPEERYQSFLTRFAEDCVEIRQGKHYLDLKAANAGLLADNGVEDVTVVTDCTSCNPLLGSFRRDGPRSFTPMLAIAGHFAHQPRE